ncbi:MAG: porin [Holophagaceae bacterium]|uniref:Porin n=1 Tax=Candidatus Geothrix skivensis TaxID=2954439 RepID=A0A9D7SJ30_9BACT|nr:porin [Candidatus Geothrix skivensis]
MNIRFAVVAAASALVALPSWGADLQVAPGTTFSISGFFGIGLKQSSLSNTVRAGVKDEIRLDDNTSRIFFSGSSKIADGYNVVFQVGSRFTTDVRPTDSGVGTIPAGQITGWADDDTWAGVATPYGRLIFGKNSFYWSDTIGLPHLAPVLDSPGEHYRIWDANGLTTFNILNQTPTLTKTNILVNSYVLGITRSRNVLRYDSPNFSGFDLAVALSKNPVGDEVKYPGFATPDLTKAYGRAYNEGLTTYLRARYNKSGIALHASYLDQKIMGGTYNAGLYNGALDTKAYRLGGGYKFPFGLKVGLVYDHTELANGISGTGISASTAWDATLKTGAAATVILAPGSITAGDAKRDAFELAASYTLGDHMFHATYGKAGNVSSINDSGADQINLVWDYALTKRTFVGLVYTNLKNGKNGHYAPFLAGSNFGPTAPNPISATATPTNSFNGENWSQIGINVQFWF